ncbi:hypothetical protein FA13DRAFT_1723825 [Coprinellus micaceus]|uniref:Uncharacterized protein n=1 Tax=Coprinellus micaceus TaxID=71717 RepID=A0A4Y7U1D6_COPMI|nr:hypothetical protein FA13DRAFT_1723825 [Coprinellus micaceus]
MPYFCLVGSQHLLKPPDTTPALRPANCEGTLECRCKVLWTSFYIYDFYPTPFLGQAYLRMLHSFSCPSSPCSLKVGPHLPEQASPRQLEGYTRNLHIRTKALDLGLTKYQGDSGEKPLL